MIKMTKRLILLMICWGLATVIFLTVSSNIVNADPPQEIGIGKDIDSVNIIEGNIENFPQENAEKQAKKDRQLGRIGIIGNESNQEVGNTESKDSENESLNIKEDNNQNIEDNRHYHIGLIAGIILNLLITIGCFVILNISIKSKKKETINTNIEDLKTKTSKLEKNINILYQEVNKLKPVLPNNNYQKIENTKLINRYEESSYKVADKLDPKISVISVTSRIKGVFKIEEILSAFSEMMSEVDKATAWESRSIREDFANKYKVIAYKCVNSEERINSPKIPPIFEEGTLLESKLWCVALPDDTLAVFPNPGLQDYENGTHYQSGMKELFDSNYTSGNYRKIEVIKPAIVTRNFRTIKQKGELILSH